MPLQLPDSDTLYLDAETGGIYTYAGRRRWPRRPHVFKHVVSGERERVSRSDLSRFRPWADALAEREARTQRKREARANAAARKRRLANGR